MAKLPQISRLSREDYRGAPPWFEKLLIVLNMFINSVYQALSGNLTMGDNIRAAVQTISITASTTSTATTTSIPLPVWKPMGVFIIQCLDSTSEPLYAAPGVSWKIGQGKIDITAFHGLTSGHKYTITMVVI